MITVIANEAWFADEAVSTEQSAFGCIAASPLTARFDYLAVPWAAGLNRGQLPSLQLSPTKSSMVTVCQHVKFLEIIPELKRLGVIALFCPHVEESSIEGIDLLPFPHVAAVVPTPRSALPVKDLLYSFIGFGSHEIRSEVFAMEHPENTVIKSRDGWHFWRSDKDQESSLAEYSDTLARSRFSLCPRGYGPSTIRFWESLAFGAIPVSFADSMLLPEYDWDSCIIQIPEADIKWFPSMLNAISEEAEVAMRENCLKAYEAFSGANLVQTIRDYCGEAK